VRVIDPEIGQMACKTYGKGRLAPVETIVDYVSSLLQRALDLKGRHVLSQPVRLSRISIRYAHQQSPSGKMGQPSHYSRDRGAAVTLVSVQPISIFRDWYWFTTEEMHRASG
jgi:phosphopantothenoylcysteine decarboxylase/phosphopantothenate--cysteine ligase